MRKSFRELAETVITAVLIFVALQLAAQSFQVSGPSMQPTLQSGQRLLVNKFVYITVGDADGGRQFIFRGPQRGDIVVFRPPDGRSDDFVKRVIGVPGDEIDIRGDTVFVNGEARDEEFGPTGQGSQLYPLTVPEGMYFVLGDNRGRSNDSRAWGLVAAGNMVGRAWVGYWPLDRLRIFG